MAQMVKNLPAMGQGDALEKGMATHITSFHADIARSLCQKDFRLMNFLPQTWHLLCLCVPRL